MDTIYISEGKHKGKTRYYYYEEYETWEDAVTMGKALKLERNGLRFFVIEAEKGIILPEKIFKLYLNKKIRLNLI